jgi:tight adherence protein B
MSTLTVPAISNPGSGPRPATLPAKPFLIAATLLGACGSLVTHSALPSILALLAAVLIRSRLIRARARAAETAQCSAVVELCGALRSELQAGRQPSVAFTEAVWCRPELRDLAEAVSAPAPDPERSAPDLLVEASRAPGREGLAALAACWRAAEHHGVPLTGAVCGIEDGLRADQVRRQNLGAELSGMRTTVALLGVLPAFGLALGSALGADPIHTLLTRPVGEMCLLIGCLLEVAGLRWTDRLVASIGYGPPPVSSPRSRNPLTRWRQHRGRQT